MLHRPRAACAPLCFAFVLLACSDPADPPGDDGGSQRTCERDLDCADDLFCNGAERCAPDDPDADERGCAPATSERCEETQACDEDDDACRSDCAVAPDADGDGAEAIECGGDDCDDAERRAFPGNVELCDPEGLDEDCDPTTLGPDGDVDGFVRATCCNLQRDGSLRCGDDCDDANREVSPDAPEVCGPRDDDCDTRVDEMLSGAFHADCDGDMFGGATGEMVLGCAPPPVVPASCGSAPLARWSDNDDDCDDARAGRNPGNPEVCNGIDDDCDLRTDEGFEDASYHPDCDGDGHGAAGGETSAGCTPPPVLPASCGSAPSARWALGVDDCDDARAAVYPGAVEVCGNTIDDDCDTRTDEGGTPFHPDGDGDGFGRSGSTAVIACSAPAGHSPNASDCDDTRASVRPGAQELCDGTRDDDCDGAVDELPAAAIGCGSVAGTTFGCSAGTCEITACAAPRDDCDTTVDNGCESDTSTSRSHCGACGNECTTGLYCAASACRPRHVWSYTVGGSGSGFDVVDSMVIDGAGNVTAVGLFAGAASYGPTSVTTLGMQDGYVVSYTPAGAIRWSQRVGGAGATSMLTEIARDAAGNVFVVGHFDMAISAGSGTLASVGGTDVVVASYTAGGAHRWSRRFGGAGGELAKSIAVDPAGNVIVAALINGVFDVGGGPMGTATRSSMVVLSLSNASGAYQWARAITPASTNGVQPERLTTDASGNVHAVGYFSNATDFGTGTLTPIGNDVFVVSLSPAGATRWVRHIGSSGVDLGRAIAIEPGGDVIVAGEFDDTVDFGTGSLSARGATWRDVFVARLDAATGATEWARRFGDVESEIVHAVAVDASGEIFVGGSFDGVVDFGGGVVTGTSGSASGSPFLLGLSSTGAYRFVRAMSGDGSLASIAPSASRLHVGGSFGRSMDVGGGALPAYDALNSVSPDGWIAVYER
ncbi:MopE-related protein [Sandaracinus amylolyticus]|uniref:BNR repeat domain protein n=1 Tax=Sandaracinus amylolyticus TaxID=927083 RepID=A0A0F6YEZ6_9BACT|nr:MopE-related protein [Sandaracinus amylolyticus]AKF02985.1 BNR repeat domain protein [Sandaracinus amylolyticus]